MHTDACMNVVINVIKIKTQRKNITQEQSKHGNLQSIPYTNATSIQCTGYCIILF